MESKVQVLDLEVQHQRWTWQAVLSMLLLIGQSTALSIVLRLSRVRQGTPYLASVSVVLTEGIKLALCGSVVMVAAYRKKEGVWSAMADTLRDAYPMAVPAFCFVMQQILLVLAATNLDVVSFQVFNQSFKLVPTAILAWLLLGQKLRAPQWASIPVLVAGVVLVTLNGAASPPAAGGGLGSSQALDPAATRRAWLTGSLACATSGLSSAYAGVHFEKYLKGTRGGTLTTRNVQLGVFGLPLAVGLAAVRDGAAIAWAGPLQGFGTLAWSVVGLQVFGGLAMGMVVKHCDNIIKNFALAVSVILTVLLAVPLFGQWPSHWFLAGVACILLSISLYASVLDAASLSIRRTMFLKLVRGSGRKSTVRQRYLAALGLLALTLCTWALLKNLAIDSNALFVASERPRVFAQVAALVKDNSTRLALITP